VSRSVSQMQEKLPREERDIVYEYILPGCLTEHNAGLIFELRLQTIRAANGAVSPRYHLSWPRPTLAHLTRATFVGAHTLQ
jgi:hypothetical protein